MFNHLKRKFVTGLFVLIPVGITIFILKFLFSFADGILGPYLARLFSAAMPNYQYFPGLGMLTGMMIIYFTGLIAGNVIGKSMLHWWEGILNRIPLVKSIYNSTKQIIQVFREGKNAYRRAVLIDWPRKGVKVIAFVTSEVERDGQKLVAVFLPTTPNPTSGFALFVPAEEVYDAGMTVEEAIKFIVSGGAMCSWTEKTETASAEERGDE